MPMGLKGIAQTFQRTLQIILSGLQWQTCLIYLDDINVFRSTFDEHLKRVKEVLECIHQTGLKLKVPIFPTRSYLPRSCGRQRQC